MTKQKQEQYEIETPDVADVSEEQPAVDANEQPVAGADEQAEPEPEPMPAPTTSLLTAVEILAADDLVYEDIPIPEWTPGWVKDGGVEPRCMRLRILTADEALSFAEAQDDVVKARNTMINLISRCAIDENGIPIFSEEDVEKLLAKSFLVYKRLQRSILLLNDLAVESEPLEDEKKDSESSPSDASSTS